MFITKYKPDSVKYGTSGEYRKTNGQIAIFLFQSDEKNWYKIIVAKSEDAVWRVGILAAACNGGE